MEDMDVEFVMPLPHKSWRIVYVNWLHWLPQSCPIRLVQWCETRAPHTCSGPPDDQWAPPPETFTIHIWLRNGSRFRIPICVFKSSCGDVNWTGEWSIVAAFVWRDGRRDGASEDRGIREVARDANNTINTWSESVFWGEIFMQVCSEQRCF